MKKVIKGSNFKVTLNLPTISKVVNPKKVMNVRTQVKLGREVEKAIKDRVATGLSPVKGVGRYKSYASTRNGEGYPNTKAIKSKYPNKKTRPVNLKLSGKFLKKLKYKRINGGIDIGWFNVDQRTKDLIEAHQLGLNTKKKVPQRKILPTKKGEQFVSPIQRLIKNIVKARISDIIKKGS